MSIQLEKSLITVQRYYQMAKEGILKSEDRVELLNGKIVRMSPASSLHASTVKKINRLFSKILKEQFLIQVQDPIEISAISEPEPDIVIANFKEDYYHSR